MKGGNVGGGREANVTSRVAWQLIVSSTFFISEVGLPFTRRGYPGAPAKLRLSLNRQARSAATAVMAYAGLPVGVSSSNLTHHPGLASRLSRRTCGISADCRRGHTELFGRTRETA